MGSPVPRKQKTVAPIPQHLFTLTVTYEKLAGFDSETAIKRGQQERVVLGEGVVFDQIVTVEGGKLHACGLIGSLSCYKGCLEF